MKFFFNNKQSTGFLIGILFLFLFSAVGSARPVGDSLKKLPVQSGGRVQPFDTFARDSLRFIYGKVQLNKKPAVDILMSWILLPEYWSKTEFIQIRDSVLRKALKLDLNRSLFSPEELLRNRNFIQELSELRVKRENKEPLNTYFKSLQKLENRLSLYRAFQAGSVPGWVPAGSHKTIDMDKEGKPVDIRAGAKTAGNKGGGKKSWRPFSELHGEEKKLFLKIIQTYVSFVSVREKTLSGKGAKSDHLPEKTQKQDLEKAVAHFQEKLQSKYPEYEKYLSRISIELNYNQLNPFRLAWIFYLLGFLLLFLYFLFRRKMIFYISLAVWTGAFCIQGFGMVLRSLIMERPPVTNMYETVIWVPWVTVILGAWLWWRQKMFPAFVCACAVALFCLLLADSAPTLLDGRLEPLEAVLRSNFWLIIHVLVITMSYSAFFLAFAIGDALLFIFLRNGKKERVDQNKIRAYAICIDRSIQVGVVLLALGTVLGGVWADYSWGRFWGWDPKETWALISLLGYLVLLHSRLMGWVKEFGLAVGAVLVFFLIVMAWYGVNYVLGQGLHSYGFGAGGVEYVASFALLHLIYILLVWTLRYRQGSQGKTIT